MLRNDSSEEYPFSSSEAAITASRSNARRGSGTESGEEGKGDGEVGSESGRSDSGASGLGGVLGGNWGNWRVACVSLVAAGGEVEQAGGGAGWRRCDSAWELWKKLRRSPFLDIMTIKVMFSSNHNMQGNTTLEKKVGDCPPKIPKRVSFGQTRPNVGSLDGTCIYQYLSSDLNQDLVIIVK